MLGYEPPPGNVGDFNWAWKKWIAGLFNKLRPEDWIDVTLENSWVNYGVTYNDAGFYKDGFGRVHLRGLVKSGTVGNTIFTLPEGYRPESQELHVTISNAALGRCDINTDGTVVATTGNNTYFALDGISFKAV